jgi:hypothetical protein
VPLAERADEFLRGLPRGWDSARLDVTLEEPEDAERAALILASAAPGRSGSTFRLHVASGGGRAGATPEMVRRVLRRLDAEGIRARIKLAGYQAQAAEPAAAEPDRPGLLAAQWDALAARLPSDWSDLYAEVELDSSDFLERGALLLAPVNPARYGKSATLRFRAARNKGYGVAAGMARRALERLDEEAITGRVRVLRVLSGTDLAATQGPIWRIGGRGV